MFFGIYISSSLEMRNDPLSFPHFLLSFGHDCKLWVCIVCVHVFVTTACIHIHFSRDHEIIVSRHRIFGNKVLKLNVLFLSYIWWDVCGRSMLFDRYCCEIAVECC